MFAPLVLLVLATAPRALPDADLTLYVPNLPEAQGELAFFEQLSHRSALLDPRGWSRDLNPLVPLDLTHLKSFTDAGLDPKGPATWSVRGDLKLSCATLADEKRFTQKADERLKTLGDPWTAKVDAIELHGAKVAGEVEVGYVLAQKTACTVTGPGAERTLRYTARWLQTSWPQQANLPHVRGHIFVLTSSAAAGFTGDAKNLQVDGQGDARLALEARKAPTFALPTDGMFRSRASFDPKALAHWARRALAIRCERCVGDQLANLEKALDETLTGEALVRVDRFQPTGPLSSPAGQLTALRFGAVAKLSKVTPALRQALSALGKGSLRAGASGSKDAAPDTWTVPVEGGALELGLEGNLLYVSNDGAARDRALAAARRKRRPAHALDFALDPTLTANGVGRISLLDALTNRQLATAFAAATEAVPVLRGTRAFGGWVDAAHSPQHFGATWGLVGTP